MKQTVLIVVGACLFWTLPEASAKRLRSPEYEFFYQLQSIVESNRYVLASAEMEVDSVTIAKSQSCVSVSREKAPDYFYENVVETELENFGPHQRSLTRAYFNTSESFIFCQYLKSDTWGEQVEFDTVINVDRRELSFTVTYDGSEGPIQDE